MYAVIFTYNFDNDSTVTLFDNEADAKNYLKDSFMNELHAERDENGWDVEADILDDGWYAYIHALEYDDICEYRLTGDVKKL